MTTAGTKIIEGLKEAIAGSFAAVTIEGQRWVRVEHDMTPDERLEAAARLICETDPRSPGPDEPIMIGSKRAKAWEPRAEIIRRAVDAGLFAWPPKAWIAPMEMTEGMRAGIQATHTLAFADNEYRVWSAARDAYLKVKP